ncbi:MAG: DNA alkylation repair protein, partial [Candidatus Latescibacterota bacterium]
LEHLGDAKAAAFAQRFFKTGKGQYGEGDIFRGIRVPVLQQLANKHKDISLSDAQQLLCSGFHEDRLLALFILVHRYLKGDSAVQRRIYTLYLENTKSINNWDLVDASAEHVIGRFLIDRDKEPLTGLALSTALWERRIAIMATFHFIKKGRFGETFRIARLLRSDREDLIHKAVGWMLREVGKRDVDAEEGFLREHYTEMPRTMLRYAIERFPEPVRQAYLRGEVGTMKSP